MPKAQYKATLFSSIFMTPKDFISLLNYVTKGENTLTEDDITPFSLDSDILKRELINDVSFITKDGRLIILIEHQFTENPNIALRLLLYYLELLRLWAETNHLNMYGTKKLTNVPLPEFYVVYNGATKLKNSISTFDIDHKGIKISVKANIIDINFANLNITQKSDNLLGYAYFHKQMVYYKLQGHDIKKAFKLTSQDCKKEGYLTNYINREDFNYMYTSIMDYAKVLEAEAIERGMEQGLEQGLERGLEYSSIRIYYTELNLTSAQIAEKLSSTEERVNQVLDELGLL